MLWFYCLVPFSFRANSSSFIPFDLIPIALIRDPGFFPHVPIILFRFPAFPVTSLACESNSYKDLQYRLGHVCRDYQPNMWYGNFQTLS